MGRIQGWFSCKMCPGISRTIVESTNEFSSRDKVTWSMKHSERSMCSASDRFPSEESNCCSSDQDDRPAIAASSSFDNRRNKSYARCPYLGVPRVAIILVLALFYLVSTECTELDPDTCAPDLKTPGRTWPAGDIIVEAGHPLEIYCILRDPPIRSEYFNKNASDLAFFLNNKLLPQAYYNIVNRTTIKLHVNKTVPSQHTYYCKMDMSNDTLGKRDFSETVCMNEVAVGHKPQEPKNFTCHSENWQNLTCTWEPLQNYVRTLYSLSYSYEGRASRRQLFDCPPLDADTPNSCFLSFSTVRLYRQQAEYYVFSLKAENKLGNNSYPYRFHHWAHVIPAPPENLNLTDKTSSSATLRWTIPSDLVYFSPKLDYRICYQDQWNSTKGWKVIDIDSSKCEGRTCSYNLTALPFPNIIYDVRVKSKSRLAIDDDNSWGKFSSVTFRTAPIVPGQAPRVDEGSFEILKHNRHREVYIYWQFIPHEMENGNDFRYRFINIEENGRRVNLEPVEPLQDGVSYAKFNISFEKYKFEIVAENEVGYHAARAVVNVPSLANTPDEPTAFTKIAFDDGRFELSWNPPAKVNVTSYTIFWCQHDRERPYQCSGYLNWSHVSKNMKVYNVSVPRPDKVYQFAIAANTETGSSGMVWALCTVIHNKLSGKMKQVWINEIDANSIKLGWNLDCTDRIDMVEGFVIFYCPTMSPVNDSCAVAEQNTTVKAGPHTIMGEVKGLTPYTTYKFAIGVLSKNDLGPRSDWLYNTTLEAPPSEPVDVKVTEVTNTSIKIEWSKPEQMNGVLRYYLVSYNDAKVQVERATSFELKNLTAYTRYVIRVSACTIECGEEYPPINVKTKVGVPGKMNKPDVRFANGSIVEVSWETPSYPAGPVVYYEIKTNDGGFYSKLRGHVTQLPIPNCNEAESGKLNEFYVRAVNTDEMNNLLPGPWSASGQGNCWNGGPSGFVWVIIYIIASLSGVTFILIMIYMVKRMWQKYEEMQNIEIKLPPGLASNTTLLDKTRRDKDQHIEKSSAESSGCSSGQESVTSSLTSESRVSSDSGTEVDQIPTSPDKLLESPPSWETSTLRQRNVGSSKPENSNRDSWGSCMKVSKTADSTLVEALSSTRSTPNLAETTGYSGLQQPWPSTGYISMPSSEDVSSAPSPGSKGKPHGGSYSVVGIAPKALRSKTPDGSNNLIPLTNEATAKNAYVTLATLEKQKPPVARPKSSLEDFDLKLNELLTPFSVSDQLSKPYIQSGFADATRNRFVVTTASPHPVQPLARDFFTAPSQRGSQIESNVQPTESKVASTSDSKTSSTLESELPTAYVAISSVADLPSAQQPHVDKSNRDSIESLLDDFSYSCHQQPAEATSSTSAEKSVPAGATSVPLTKQPSGYVTITDNLVQSDNSKSTPQTATQYVPHQRLKMSPPNQENAGQSDEQYSKVTVVMAKK